MILAAGLSTRLRPLTDSVPKPLLPFWHLRLLDFTLAYLGYSGIRMTAMNVHHGREPMLKALKGPGLAVPVRPFEEKVILGTGGGIRNMKAFVTDDTFAVVNCDFLTDVDLKEAMRFHESKQALATMVIVEDPQPKGYKPVGVDGEGRIVSFPYGKPPGGAVSFGFFSGIHIFSRQIFAELPQKGIFDINQDVYARLIERKAPVFGFVSRCRWLDVGESDLYAKAQWNLLGRPFPWMDPLMTDLRPKGLEVLVAKTATVSKTAVVTGPALVSPGARIDDGAFVGPYAVIGVGASVGSGARVEQSVVYPGADIPPGAALTREIVKPGTALVRI
jgi:NDP-sugar pyrophosphorylase family protein